MSTMATEFHVLHRSRLRTLVFPREHGAWGMLLIPLVSGAWIAHPTADRLVALFTFAAAALALFCLRTPVEAWLQASAIRAQTGAEQRIIIASIILYSSVAGFALAWLFWKERATGLLLLGAAAASAFIAQAVLKKLGRHTRTNAQLIGSLGLTSTAAGAYLVVRGGMDRAALIVWAANWLFAANQIHYVQMRIHAARAGKLIEKLERGGTSFLIHQALAVGLLAIAFESGWLPRLSALAFAPALVRGLLWFRTGSEPLHIHRLGVTELAYALAFGAVFILGFQLSYIVK